MVIRITTRYRQEGKSREKGTSNKERKLLGYSVEGEGEQAGTSQTTSELQRCQDDLPKGTKQNRKQKESAKKQEKKMKGIKDKWEGGMFG